MTDWDVIWTLLGLTVITVVTRSVFFLSRRELVFPEIVQRGLRYAPLAALMAVVAPEVVMAQGQFNLTWRDPRLWAAAAAMAYFFWRRGLMGTIVSGMAVFGLAKWLWG